MAIDGFREKVTGLEDTVARLDKKLEAVEEWGRQFEYWTPEEHDAFLRILKGGE